MMKPTGNTAGVDSNAAVDLPDGDILGSAQTLFGSRGQDRLELGALDLPAPRVWLMAQSAPAGANSDRPERYMLRTNE